MSTIQVDRIIPYQSASVTVEGLSAPNLATTGSNTFVGDQNIQGTLTASIQEGFVLAGGAGDISVLVATSSFIEATADLGPLNTFTASQEVLNATYATTGSNTFNGDQVVQGTDKQTFSDPGDNQEVKTISVNSFVDSQGYTMGINTFGWYHFNSEGHQGFSSNLWTSDYAYGGAWFHDPNKFEYILFPSGAAYDSNTFGLYDNGDTTTKFRVLADKIELTGSAELSGSQTLTGNLTAGGNINATSNIRVNPNFDSSFLGIKGQWNAGSQTSTLTAAEQKSSLILNAFPTDFTYDEYLLIDVDVNGVQFRDFDSGYTAQTWLQVTKSGNPSFKRTIEVTGSVEISEVLQLAAQDPLPANGVGQLAVSGSNLYYNDGSTWSQIN